MNVQCNGANIEKDCEYCSHYEPHPKSRACNRKCWRDNNYHCVENIKDVRKAKLLKLMENDRS